jgi:hypothetical protein
MSEADTIAVACRGSKATAFIRSKRPKSIEGMTNWREKSKKLLNGEDGVPKVTGLLSAFTGPEGPAENLDRTERLVRLLIAADRLVADAEKQRTELLDDQPADQITTEP